MEYNEAVVDYWREHYIDENTRLCSLCSNTGTIVNTTNEISPTTGVRIARINYCICPNGQTMRNAFIKGRQLGKNNFYINLGGEIDDKK